MVGVAQLVEPRIVIPVVVGSSPIVHPNFKRDAAVEFSPSSEIMLLQFRDHHGSLLLFTRPTMWRGV